MPRKQMVYGRRKGNFDLVAGCFAVSSSPAKQTSPVSRTDEPYGKAPTQRSRKDDAGIRSLVSSFDHLSVGDNGEDVFNESRLSVPTSRANRGLREERRVLRNIDVNVRRGGSPTLGCGAHQREIKFRDLKRAETANDEAPATPLRSLEKEVEENAGSGRLSSLRSSSKREAPKNATLSFDSTTSSPTRNRRSARDTRSPRMHAAHASPSLRALLQLSNDPKASVEPSHFRAWGDEIAQFFKVTKFAEASYGEVYRLSLEEPDLGFEPVSESVLKLVALKPPTHLDENARPSRTKTQQKRIANMSAIDDVASEVRLLQHMSAVPGFANFRDVKVMQGQLPKQFISAWRTFNKDVRKSEFPDPGRKPSYEECQLWAIVEMQDAGRDLETIRLETVWECWDAFWGVALSLAKGEEFANFEHRDLHLGNICVKRVDDFEEANVDIGRRIGFSGLQTMLIDYTLSRADLAKRNCHSPLRGPTSPSKTSRSRVPAPTDNRTAFFDLSREHSIFNGDAEEDYQYEIYRLMRSLVLHGDACHDSTAPSMEKLSKDVCQKPGTWEQYHPLTNVLWLHYILYKLMEQLSWPSSCKKPSRPSQRQLKVRERAVQLEERLQLLSQMIDPSKLKRDSGGLQSAGDLVTWAVGQGWLSEDDVVRTNEEDLALDLTGLSIG